MGGQAVFLTSAYYAFEIYDHSGVPGFQYRTADMDMPLRQDGPNSVTDGKWLYRRAIYLDENRALFTLQTLTKANDAEDVRVESTRLKDYDIES